MKFTLSWLHEHLDTTASVDEIAETLTDLGLEVEGVENPAEKLRDFTIGKVQTAEQHPDADRLRVCMVETDEGVKQIICGAPNARAGITVVIAKPGTYVPGIDTTIQVGKIRGVESYGMMASEREMELSDEHDGIIELPSGEVGESFADWLADKRSRPCRSGDRNRDHPQPPRRAGRRRHRPRSGRARSWHAKIDRARRAGARAPSPARSMSPSTTTRWTARPISRAA